MFRDRRDFPIARWYRSMAPVHDSVSGVRSRPWLGPDITHALVRFDAGEIVRQPIGFVHRYHHTIGGSARSREIVPCVLHFSRPVRNGCAADDGRGDQRGARGGGRAGAVEGCPRDDARANSSARPSSVTHTRQSAIPLTKVVDGDRWSAYSWYDNEFGYTNSLVEHVLDVAKHTAIAV